MGLIRGPLGCVANRGKRNTFLYRMTMGWWGIFTVLVHAMPSMHRCYGAVSLNLHCITLLCHTAYAYTTYGVIKLHACQLPLKRRLSPPLVCGWWP